jgi:hypothetical protein
VPPDIVLRVREHLPAEFLTTIDEFNRRFGLA